ncbi:MAG: XRE family transcriptional regulator [Bacillota bacterium]|nr:XRE family transcriptional regulator [Bacillota bacterium]
MARKWSEIREKMSPERRERNREKTAALLLAMDLAGLRDNMDLTQEEVAARLQISQSNVSRLEKRRDMLVSTLREVVEAFGGELHLVAEFPDGAVEISQFDEGEAA